MCIAVPMRVLDVRNDCDVVVHNSAHRLSGRSTENRVGFVLRGRSNAHG